MNYPYSKQKWLALTVAAVMATSLGVASAKEAAPAPVPGSAAANSTVESKTTDAASDAAKADNAAAKEESTAADKQASDAKTTPADATKTGATTTDPKNTDASKTETTTTTPAGANTQNPTTTTAPTAAAEKLTLAKAIEQSLKTNPTLQSLRIDADSADINLRVTNFNLRGIPDSFVDSLDAAKQKYVSGQRAEVNKKVNDLGLKIAESKIKLGAEKVYYDVINAQADLDAKKQSLARAQTQLKVTKAAVDVGTRAKTDLLQAEMGLSGAQANLASAENSLEVAKMKLNDFMGVSLDKKYVLTDVDKQVQTISMSLDKAKEAALANRLEIRQKEALLGVAELNLKIVDEYSSLATFPGQSAKKDVEKAKLDIETEKRSIEMEVAEAYYNLNAAKLGVEFNKKAKESAAESYRLTNLRFENGLATTLEVIQAEEELSNRENQYQTAQHNYNIAVVNFENAIGK